MNPEQVRHEAPPIPLYHEAILQTFKKLFFKSLNHEKEIHYEPLVLQTLQELGLEEYAVFDLFFLRSWFEKIDKLKFLVPFVAIENLNEILVHGHHDLQLDCHGKMSEEKITDLTKEDYQYALEVLCHKNNVAWNYARPFESFSTFIQGIPFRATLIHHSVTPNKESKLFLRRPSSTNYPLQCFGLTEDSCHFIKEALKSKKNIIISGATGSGKTSFINTMLEEIPLNEHLVILEDVHEITSTHPHRTNLIADQEKEKKSLKDFCAYALRMRPDRIIIGEMRSHEVVPFILAMNTGHKGLMSTLHANSAKDAISRLGVLFSLYSGNKDLSYELILKLICQNVDYIVHLENKLVVEIVKILGCEGENPFFERMEF